LAWAALKPAMRCGAAPAALSPDDAYVSCLAGLNWTQLGWRHSSDPDPLVYLGTPGPRRKAIVHLIDPASHVCDLIVKVPLTDAAKWAIRHEAQALVQLQQAGFTAAPRLVHLDEAPGIASQTVVTGLRAGLHCSREVAVLLHHLKRPDDCLTLRQVACSFAATSVQRVLDEAGPDVLAKALVDMDDDSAMPAVRIHGDFAPWNIKLHNGTAALVDWEDSHTRGLPLHDAYHFVHMVRCLFGKQPRPMCRELRFRYPFNLPALQRRRLEVAYLLQMLLRDCPQAAQSYRAYLLATLRLTVAERL